MLKNELWRGWEVFYQPASGNWWPIGSYKSRAEAKSVAIKFADENNVKTMIKRVVMIKY